MTGAADVRAGAVTKALAYLGGVNGVIELLADNNFGDTRPNALAGPTGLVIILLLVVATILLIRNMSKRLKRLPDSFPGQAKAPEMGEFHAEADESPDAGNGRHDADDTGRSAGKTDA